MAKLTSSQIAPSLIYAGLLSASSKSYLLLGLFGFVLFPLYHNANLSCGCPRIEWTPMPSDIRANFQSNGLSLLSWLFSTFSKRSPVPDAALTSFIGNDQADRTRTSLSAVWVPRAIIRPPHTLAKSLQTIRSSASSIRLIAERSDLSSIVSRSHQDPAEWASSC
jgi:hypothetical protein